MNFCLNYILLRHKKLFVAILSVTVFLIYVLCGCSNGEQDMTVTYLNNNYSSVYYWYPVNENYKSITVRVNDNDHDASLYSLSGHNLIRVKGDLAGELYFLSENEQIPDYKKAGKVDKIIISEFSGNEIVLKSNSEIKEWINIFLNAEDACLKDDVIGSINIYYKEFPAYQYIGNLCKNGAGQYTIALN